MAHREQVHHVRRLLDPALVAAVLLLTGTSFFGDTPDTRDSSTSMATWFVGHRTDVLLAVVIAGPGLLALLWFTGSVTERLTAAGHRALGDLAGRATSVAVTVLAIGMLLVHAGLAYVISAEAPGSVKALFELTLLSSALVAPFLAVLPAAVAWSLRGDPDVPRWFVAVSVAAAVMIAVPAVGFADRGVLSPDVGQQLVFQGLTLWLLAAGIAWPARRTSAVTARPLVAAA